MAKDLTKIIRNVDQLVLATIKSDYTPDATTLGMFPFFDVGAMHDESASIKAMKAGADRLIDGGTFQKGYDVELKVDGMELSADQISVLEKLEKHESLAWQFYGADPQFVMPLSHVLEFHGEMNAKGKRRLACVGNRSLPTIGSSGAGNPGWGAGNFDQAVDANSEVKRFADLSRKIYKPGLQLWVDPRFGNFGNLAKLYDASLKRYVGTFNSDYASIWQTGTTPERFLRFDGVNDQCDFGNVVNLGSSDAIIEVWFRPQGSNGTIIGVLSKGNGVTGIELSRHSDNTMRLYLGDGTNSANIFSTATVVQNSWAHVAFVILRSGGNGLAFINGSQSGNGASLSSIGSVSHSNGLIIGKLSPSTFGQIDSGGVRIYDFGASGLPSNFATIINNHYNAEKAFYGL